MSSFDMHVLEVEYKHSDKDKWRKVIYGPFKNHYGAMKFYELVIQPTLLEFGANICTRPLENPGQVFGSNPNEWIKQFS